MTVKKALELLEKAPRTQKKSAVNKSFTQAQSVDIVRKGVESYLEQHDEEFVLPDIFEKRVYQVVRNQRRPRYS